jgi:membrane protease YdiL (CAAX protease family)
MTNNANNPLFSQGILSFLRFIGFILGGLFVGQFLGLGIALLLAPISIFELQGVLQDPANYPEMRVPLMVMQGITALFTFVIGPLGYIYVEGRYRMRDLSPARSLAPVPILLLAFGMIAFMMFNAIIISWNMNMELPGFLAGFEEWARSKEDQLGQLTNFLIQTETLGQFILVFVVVAVLPGIGEEILFRGVIQNIFQGWLRNPHVAIWLAAIIFSAIHMQFYGFLPRMVLGALFGYIYWYTKNLWYPIIAHFVNNGFTIIAVASYRGGLTELDIESVEAVPLPLVLGGAAIFIGIAYLFVRITKHTTQAKDGQLAESVLFHPSASS